MKTPAPAVLTTTNHSRDSAGLTYVYPVISRRSGGLSVGINLNPNNACNWRCVYCQVPELRRGAAPDTDLLVLERELRGFLEDALCGDFYRRFELPLEQRRIRDIAISGNGEPTSSPQFGQVVGLIGRVVGEYGLLDGCSQPAMPPSLRPIQGESGSPQPLSQKERGAVKLVLITNGSLVRRETVRKGLTHWGELGGEVWFKLDSATEAGIQRVNNVHLSMEAVSRNLEAAARLCPVWLQTCLFAFDGQAPGAEEQQAYLDFLRHAVDRGIGLRGVLLYGLARPSMQAEASRLAALPAEWMESFAGRVRRIGLETRLSL